MKSYKLNLEAVKYLREGYGQQSRIAKALDIELPRVNNWIRGVCGVPEKYFFRLCAAMDKTPTDILALEEKVTLGHMTSNLDLTLSEK